MLGSFADSDLTLKLLFFRLENWALSFGTSLWETARAATRFDAIQKVSKDRNWIKFGVFSTFQNILQRYHTEGAKIEEVDGFSMVTKMAANVEIMMQHKIDAIKVKIILGNSIKIKIKTKTDTRYGNTFGTQQWNPFITEKCHFFSAHHGIGRKSGSWPQIWQRSWS